MSQNTVGSMFCDMPSRIMDPRIILHSRSLCSSFEVRNFPPGQDFCARRASSKPGMFNWDLRMHAFKLLTRTVALLVQTGARTPSQTKYQVSIVRWMAKIISFNLETGIACDMLPRRLSDNQKTRWDRGMRSRWSGLRKIIYSCASWLC